MDSLQRFSRKCAQSGRDLVPGDRYVSVLVDKIGGIERHDYAAENWPGEPEESICWWRAEIPHPSQVQIRWAPDRVLRAYFQALYDNENYPVLNVLAMAMVRRKLMQLKYESAVEPAELAVDAAETEGLACSARRLTLTDRSTGDSYTFPEVDLLQVDLQAIQQELEQHLFTDQVDLEDEEEAADSSEAEAS